MDITSIPNMDTTSSPFPNMDITSIRFPNTEVTSIPFPNITPQGLQPHPTLEIPCFVLFPSDAILMSFFLLTLSLWRPQGSPPGPQRQPLTPVLVQSHRLPLWQQSWHIPNPYPGQPGLSSEIHL